MAFWEIPFPCQRAPLPLAALRLPLQTPPTLGLGRLLVTPTAHGTLCRLVQAASHPGSGRDVSEGGEGVWDPTEIGFLEA